jgi:hypothetical protein
VTAMAAKQIRSDIQANLTALVFHLRKRTVASYALRQAATA